MGTRRPKRWMPWTRRPSTGAEWASPSGRSPAGRTAGDRAGRICRRPETGGQFSADFELSSQWAILVAGTFRDAFPDPISPSLDRRRRPGGAGVRARGNCRVWLPAGQDARTPDGVRRASEYGADRTPVSRAFPGGDANTRSRQAAAALRFRLARAGAV